MGVPVETLELAQRLIRAKSPSGRESPAAAVLLAAFGALGFDEFHLDSAGNAIGVLNAGPGPVVMFNGHLDTVPEGDVNLWPHPPYDGAVADGRLWGRGSCDMKSALACMALAARDAVDRGFAGTLVVAGVVQEEVGGLGARHLLGHTQPDAVVLGEPSDLQLKVGHRGRVEVSVRLPGRIAHAAKASLGENALSRAARFLLALEGLTLPSGGPLGASTATPTMITVTPNAPNVVPGSVDLTIDYRNVVGDEPEALVQRLEALDAEAIAIVEIENATSESGEVTDSFPRVNPAYLVPPDDPLLPIVRETVSEVLGELGHGFVEGTWWFSTDAPYLAVGGAPVFGFGPGEPERAHTTEESVPVDHLEVCREVYCRLALELCSRWPDTARTRVRRSRGSGDGEG